MKFLFASGQRPLDGFTIKRGIGRGGFGEVYLALSDGGKEVALKVLREHRDIEMRHPAMPQPQAPQPGSSLRPPARTPKAIPGSSWNTSPANRSPPMERHPAGLPRVACAGSRTAAAIHYLHEQGTGAPRP
ncbi:MAG: hypothetical protein U0793_23015 [Gemmataceae bacterium]